MMSAGLSVGRIAIACALGAGIGTTPVAADPPRVAARASVEWILAARGASPTESDINPDNRTFAIPQLTFVSEWRPNLRLEIGPRVQVVARPRLQVSSDAVWQGAAPTTATTTRANWTELFIDWRATDWLGVTYGLQNYQWGPAELVGPSNRIVHDVALLRDALYYVRGRHLARVNLSAGREWSLVAMAELGAVADVDFRAGERFARSAQLKAEYQTTTGSGYVGVTAGGREGEPPWLGQYGSWEIAEGWSVYADLVQRRGSRAWYPRVTSGVSVRFEQTDVDARTIRPFAAIGTRYAFVRGADARVEYLHHDAGWSPSSFRLAALAVAASPGVDSIERYTRPGLELLGRRLALASVRVPDLGPGRRVDLQARHVRSLTDQSTLTFVNATVDASDALVAFVSGSITTGASTAEFRRFARGALVVGAVRSW